MDGKEILIFVIPLFTAVLGSYLTFAFTSRSRKDESIRKFKEDKYANLVILLQAFVGDTANANGKRQFLEENYRSWLYCSDEVTRAINGMLSLVINNKGDLPDPNMGRLAVGKIVLAMRKDLLGRTKLVEGDFLYVDVRSTPPSR